MTEFGKQLDQLRQKDGYEMTWKQLANALGISTSYLSDIINGKRSVPDDLCDKVAKTLNLPEKKKLALLDLAEKENGDVAPDIKNVLYSPSLGEDARSFIRKIGSSHGSEKFKKSILDYAIRFYESADGDITVVYKDNP